MSLSKQLRLWRLGGLSPWEFVKRTASGWKDHQLSAKSAEFAYYSMLSLVPLLILAIAALARFPIVGMLERFELLLERTLPPDAYRLVWQQVEDIQAHSSSSLAIAASVVFLFGGMRLFVAMGEGISAAFGTKRRWVRAQGVSLLFTLGILLLLLVALALLVIGPNIVQWFLYTVGLEELEGPLAHGMRWTIVVGCLLLCTSAIYRLMPAVKLPWHWLSPGNVAAVGGWMLLSQGLRFYMTYFGQYNKTYGTLAGVIVLLLWFYLTGAMLLLGGLINGVIYRAAAEEEAAVIDENGDEETPSPR